MFEGGTVMFRKNLVAMAMAVVSMTVLWSMPAFADCSKDTDCKGQRICVHGSCVYPKRSVSRQRHHSRLRRRHRRGIKVGFGASVLTGPVWAFFGFGGGAIAAGSIADAFIMNVDMNLGVCLDWRNNHRIMLGMGFRPLISKGGATYDIYLLKMRSHRSIVTGSVGVGMHIARGTVFFALQAGFGLGFNAGNHIAINIDLLDLASYYGSGFGVFTLNSLFGLSMHF